MPYNNIENNNDNLDIHQSLLYYYHNDNKHLHRRHNNDNLDIHQSLLYYYHNDNKHLHRRHNYALMQQLSIFV